VDLLPPIEDDVEILIPFPDGEELRDGKEIGVWMKGWEDGYNKSKEKYKYTEDDVRKALSESFKASQDGYNITSDEIIQSLHQYPTSFECETITMNKGYTEESDYPYQQCDIPKTTTINGRIVWVGKYI
jgi:hypothetical protein